MAISNPSPQANEVVWIQRSDGNGSYREIHVSGSNAIIYIGPDGNVNADAISDFYSAYPPPGSTGLGTGSTYPFTSSWAISASWPTPVAGASLGTGSTYPFTASWATDAISATSASYASASTSASYSITASFSLNGGGSGTTLGTGSTYPFTASWAESASFAFSASWAETSSFAFSASRAETASFAYSSSWAESSSYAPVEPAYSSSAAAYINTKQDTLTTGGSYTITASWATNAISATSASWASSSLSSSYALSASVAGSSSFPWYLIAGPYIHTDIDADVFSLTTNPYAGATVDGGLIVFKGAPSYLDWWAQPVFNRFAIYRSDLTTIIDIDPDGGNVVRFSSSLVPTASASPVLDIGTTTNRWNNIYANNLYGTASWANDTISASYALSASWAPGGSGTSLGTGSTYPFTASWAENAVSYSIVTIIESASFASASISASYALTSSFAVSASWAPPVSGTSLGTGSTYPFTSSWAISSSIASGLDAVGPIFVGSGSINGEIRLWSTDANIYYTLQANDAGTLVSGTLGADYVSVANTITAQGSITGSEFKGYGAQIRGVMMSTSSLSASFASASISASYALTSSWSIDSISATSASYASESISSSYALSASWSPPVASDIAISASFASSSISASYVPMGRSMILCAAYTPTTTGGDAAEVPTPYDPIDGTNAISWSVKRISIRTKTAESTTSSINIERSSDINAFTASLVGALTHSYNKYETSASNDPTLGFLASGDKVRFNVVTLGNSQNWTVLVEISNVETPP